MAAVGQGGVNLAADVATVQFLLNCVPEEQGGPQAELDIDGLVGPLTIGAISRFQKTTFGWFDGRVDPESSGGVTIVELNKQDPTPDAPPVLPPPPSIPHRMPPLRKGGLRTKKVSPPKTKKVTPRRTKKVSGGE
jgi:hypothetical protein